MLIALMLTFLLTQSSLIIQTHAQDRAGLPSDQPDLTKQQKEEKAKEEKEKKKAKAKKDQEEKEQFIGQPFWLLPTVQKDPRAEVKETELKPAAAPSAPPQLFTTAHESEPNDTSGTATTLSLTPTAIATGSIGVGGDVDFYTFTAPAGARVWIETDTGGTQNAGANSRDTVIDLLAADGTTVIENDDDDGTGNGGDGTIETGLASIVGGATLTTGGTYFIRVRAFSATGIVNPYRLFVMVTNFAATPEVEANDTAATANFVTSPAIRSGSIGVAGDADYYSFNASAGDTVYFNVDADPERDGTGTDLVVEFRDPADTLLLSVDSSITGSLANPAAEGANFTVAAAGTYFIKVRHFSATGTGTYHLMLVTTGAATAPLLISEFRLRGPSGAADEFVEVYNNSDTATTVSSNVGTGFAVAASDGAVRCTIPNGTVIPARGHFLCTNSVAYSLGGYAAGDASYTTDIPDNAGVALFNNNVPANFNLANRLDAVGSTSEANTLYKEGTGYPALTPFSIDYSFVRDECGKGGSITTLGPCPVSTPKDTNNNAADFYFVDTNGTSAGAGQRLGAPGPQNLAAPIQRNSTFAINLLDATVLQSSPPNRVRDFTSDPPNNSTFGTLSLRRRFVNNTGAAVTTLRFRIIDLTTFPAPSGFADTRPRTSVAVVVGSINDAATCTAAGMLPPCNVTVQGTTLEQPPSQPNGSGFNGSMSAGTVTLGTPLANGASINLQFLLGLQQTGSFKIYVNVEALP